jgi:hypothetical protein
MIMQTTQKRFWAGIKLRKKLCRVAMGMLRGRCTDLLLFCWVAASRMGRPPSERIYVLYSRKPEDSRCACQSAAGDSPRDCAW